KKNIQIAIMIGGGNICRGDNSKIDRLKSDYIGMLSTIMNSLLLQNELEKFNIPNVLMSAINISNSYFETYSINNANKYLNDNKIIILSGGIGIPYFTTDTASVIRSLEIKADVLLKGTKVNGIYNKDPMICKNVHMYDKMSYDQIYDKNISVMDKTAFVLCEKYGLPIIVFNMNKKNNLEKLINNEKIGTIVK
ncbi:MAG: UMP kinase, partial [Bacteroides sp.]